MINPIKKLKGIRSKRQMRSALIFLWRIDVFMKEKKWPAWKRKQFWHDFVKSPKSRDRLFANILKDLQ
jgi:hypothetical protein